MSTTRSRNGKSLVEDVESVFSQDESDEDNKVVNDKIEECFRSSSRAKKLVEVSTPKASQAVLQDMNQTPRRSCRKSVKPAQDYEEIVTQSLRYSIRSAKKSISCELENDENTDNINVNPRWTPAKVGRFSEKRSRKSKRTGKGKEKYNKKSKPVEEETLGNKEETIKEVFESPNTGTEALHPLNHKLEETELASESEEILKNSVSIEKTQNDIVGNLQTLNVKLDNINKDGKEVQVTDAEKEINLNQSVQLIEEHNESTHISTDKSDPEEICIIYENNIGNFEDKSEMENDIRSKSSASISSEDENSFGCYLKSNKINISDLGLNPIKGDEKFIKIDLDNESKISSQECEEMPSLIICDDDEIESKQIIKINDSFEVNKNVEDIDKRLKENEDTMETLLLSDEDCETPKKSTRKVLTNTNGQNIMDLSSLIKKTSDKEKSPSIPKDLTNKILISKQYNSLGGSSIKTKFPSKANPAQQHCTPKQEKQIKRFPTPFKTSNFKFDVESRDNIQDTPNKAPSSISLVSVTNLEPKEIVLRGIRKRSLSVCINEQQRQHFLAGSFGKQKHNRTVSFHSPANQTKKIEDLDIAIAKSLEKRKFQEKESSSKYVTTRSKRSMSFDDSFFMSASFASKLPRPVPGQNASKIQSSSLSKTLKRTKLPNFAAIHEKHFNKMENLVEHVNRKQERSKNLINSATKLLQDSAKKNIALNKFSNNTTRTKPIALKKIDLNPRPQKMSKPNLITKTVPPKKPAFNLSTSLNVKPTIPASNFVEKANTSHINNEKKVASRLQRHMELFKGGSATSAQKGSAARKNEVIVKGVRSNRRFELQMQHRKNIEQ